MDSMAEDRLVKIYELAINEEHYFLNAHQTRTAYYSGIVTALVAGVVAGLFKASKWVDLAFLCVGPVLIALVSEIAINGTYRFYQRYLEAVTVRGKIEQELGLTKSVWRNYDSYWRLESVIPDRHIKTRKDSKTSEQFIHYHRKKGYHLWTIWLFRTFQVISGLMFGGILLKLWLG